MGYLDETLKRASMQSIREYLLYGVEGEEHTTESYEERLKRACKELREIVKRYDEEGEDSELHRVINNIIAEHEHVYMEMGMQAGFRLAKQLGRLPENERHYEQYKEMYDSLFGNVTKVIEVLQEAQRDVEEVYISN